MFTRRLFLGAASALAASGLFGSHAYAESDSAHCKGLRDISFALKGDDESTAEKAVGIMRDRLARDIGRLTKVAGSDNDFGAVLDVNAPVELAKKMLVECQEKAKIRSAALTSELNLPKGYDRGLDAHTTILARMGWKDAIKKYLVANTDKDVEIALRKLDEFNPGITSSVSTYLKAPLAWLKPHIREGLKQGKDYFSIVVNDFYEDRANLGAIAKHHMKGDDSLERLLAFNGMKQGTEHEVKNGALISVPLMPKEGMPVPYAAIRDSIKESFEELRSDGRKRTLLKGSDIYHPERNLYVLNETVLPAALIESFFLSNKSELRRFSEGENIESLAKRFAAGIDNHCRRDGVKNIVLAVGHGRHEKGAIGSLDGTEYPENEFNRRIAHIIRDTLSGSHSLELLDYSGKGHNMKNERLRAYVDAANKHNPSDSIFVSVHTNSCIDLHANGIRIYVSSTGSRKSCDLGRAIAKSSRYC